MIFSELYSTYYNTVAKIITAAVKGELTDKEIFRLISDNAYGESMLSVVPAIKEEHWQLIDVNYATPLKHEPVMPLTNLQRSWLKAILNDPRIKLFGVSVEGLEETEPLFLTDDYCIYDQYSDGDNYEDEDYIRRFRIILSAVRNCSPLKIEMLSRHGVRIEKTVNPLNLEYSLKDDKFRLISTVGRVRYTINLSRIISCKCAEHLHNEETLNKTYVKRLTFELTDERNALERAMLHFAHFEKAAVKLDDRHYQVTISYDSEDETEMIIRILSFGPFIKVISPESVVNLIKERLKKQRNCNLK